MARISRLDFDIIDARVRAEAERPPATTASRALLRLVLRTYFPATDGPFVESLTDGPNDRGVDAVHFVEDDDQAEIYIFQSKYREGQLSTDKTINDSECLKLAAFLEELFDRSSSLENVGNFRLQQAIENVWALHDRGVICNYKVVLCSNDAGLSASATSILETLSRKHSQVTFEHYGPRDLLRDFGATQSRAEDGDIQVVGREIYERVDGDVRGAVASIDAKSFINLISDDGGVSVKRNVFDDNLRMFLGVSGGYNPAIISTATSLESYLFWYLNNGITITCRNYSYNKGHLSPIVKLKHFQIVNGAQTSHSLMEAYRQNPDAVSNVVLNVRIYATDRDDIVERVAVATNSQARIQDRDLKANHPILKKMELAFASEGYFFERKRNMFSDKDASRRIDALKLGQIILAFHLNEPDRARGESDAIFGSRFYEIFHDGYDIRQLVGLFNLYRKIELMREDYYDRYSDSIESGGAYQYLVYGHWFILFATKLILSAKGDGLPSETQTEGVIVEAIELVARACSQNKAVAHYQMFRSPKTREKILSEFYGKQGELFPLG
jgi:hypothetical protein